MATEWSDPLVLATIFTGIALSGSLVVLCIQIMKERKDVKNSTYERIRSDFSKFSLFLAEHPDIANYVENSNSIPNNKQFENQAKRYFDGLLGLFERTWYAKDTIGDQQWINWQDWLKYLMKNPLFKDVVNDTANFYDRKFIETVKGLTKSVDSDNHNPDTK